MTGASDVPYNIKIYDSSDYYGAIYSTNFTRANYTANGTNYFFKYDTTLYPITHNNVLTALYRTNLSPVSNVTYNITDRNTGISWVDLSSTGTITYPFIHGHTYMVNASAYGCNNYNVTDVIVLTDNPASIIFMDLAVDDYTGGYVYYGNVRDDYNGLLLGNVLVCMYNPNGTLISSTRSDNSGRYSIYLPLSYYTTFGDYRLEGNVSGYYNKSESFYFDNDGVNYINNIDIVMSKRLSNASCGAFEVTVYDYTGSLLNNVNVSVYDEPLLNGVTCGYTVNGFVRIEGINPGYYTLTFKYPNRVTGYIPSQQIIADNVTKIVTTLVTDVSHITPTPYPSYQPGQITPTPITVPTPTGYNPAQEIGNATSNFLIDLGISGDYQGVVIGLFVIIFLCMLVLIAGTSSTVVAPYTLPGVIIMAIIGFIFDCLMGFFPIWLLALIAIIVGGIIVWQTIGK
jgi:hypothetical protein